jgi:hypothetical protein
VSFERFAKRQGQTSADVVVMSHVSSRIEKQAGGSLFATAVKVPKKLVHIPLHKLQRPHRSIFRRGNNATPMMQGKCIKRVR